MYRSGGYIMNLRLGDRAPLNRSGNGFFGLGAAFGICGPLELFYLRRRSLLSLLPHQPLTALF